MCRKGVCELHIAAFTNDVIAEHHLKETISSAKYNKNMELIINTYSQFEPLLYMLTTDMVHYDMVILTESDGLSERILQIRFINRKRPAAGLSLV